MKIKPEGIFSIANPNHYDDLEKIGKALSSKLRLEILRQIHLAPMTITELAKINNITTSTVIFHTNILMDANLIHMQYKPGKKGKTQVFFLLYGEVHLNYDEDYSSNVEEIIHTQSMPIGYYTNARFDSYVRFATLKEWHRIDEKDAFNPLVKNAELIWTGGGMLEYSFSNKFALENKVKEISISLEICSETFGHLNDWKSDITFAINGVELLTYTSPGDYGGKLGKLNPEWWSSLYTQYGDLITISINNDGVFLNNQIVNKKITLKDLHLKDSNRLLFSLYNKLDAEFYGGFNLFGKRFGNHEQDIVLSAICEAPVEHKVSGSI